MAKVHRQGLTELYAGRGLGDEIPKAQIVFVHGLGGHAQNTWSSEEPAPTDPADRRPSDTSMSSSGGRKGSLFGKRFTRRTKPTSPEGGLGDRTMSTPISTFSMETRSNSISPGEILEDPLSREPESIQSPTTASASSSKDKVFWPRDLLPNDFPDVRIFTYGYDSRLASLSSTGARGTWNITQYANDFLVRLNQELDDNVPVIICAHSLGGVITKKALWESKTADNANPAKRKLAKLTKVIMFFGTPHKGSDAATWAQIGTKIVAMAKLDALEHLSGSLKLDSEILNIVHSDFMKLLHGGAFYIHVFQEARPMGKGMKKIVSDLSSKIDNAPNCQHEMIDGNHRSMIRYRTADASGYRQVVSALKHYMKKLDKAHDIERASIASNYSASIMPSKIYFSVPYARNEKYFVGRQDTLDAIDKKFNNEQKSYHLTLHGIGGIGKTQVAIELAHRWRKDFPGYSIFWVHATNAARFEEGMLGILKAIGFESSADINVHNVVEQWLRNKNNGRWLIVVDNVDSEDVLNQGSSSENFELLSCLPHVEHGRILFTTRYRHIALKLSQNDNIRLDHMSSQEALDLLKRCLGDQYDESERADAEELLEELSNIPLAIAQAAAFIQQNEIPISEYLEIYEESDESQTQLLEREIKNLGIADSETPKSVLRTSEVSFSRIKADGKSGPLAMEFISLMSCLDRQEIPRALLQELMPKERKMNVTNALGLLRNYSLIMDTEMKNFSMHRLVQKSMRKWLEKQGTLDKYREAALSLLAETFPDGSFPTWKDCMALIVHADTVLELTADTENLSARSKLLQNCANFQNGRGQYAAAELKLTEVVKLRTELVGEDNTETLRAKDQLAWTLRSQAKNDRALELAKQTLAKKQEIFGEKSAEALTTSHIVAMITADRGQHSEAEKIDRVNWEARTELLGPEHPDTLRSAAHLALELWELGKFSEAEELARETLESRTQLLGPEHPDTLEIQGTLGFILEIQTRYEEAEQLKSEMLEIRERIYGEDHPDTADSCHDMGWILHQMGRYSAAEPFYDRALKAKERLLGETHWKTLTTMCNFPVFYCDKGEYTEAEKRSKRLIAVFKRVQGPNHPQTLDATGGLAVILRHQDKLVEAAAAAKKSIDGRNVVLGPDHPWTLPPVAHWGYILTLQGKHEEGEKVIRDALSGLEKTMGSVSSNVCIALVFLSKNLLRQASVPDDPKLEESEKLASRALEARKKLLGKDHPYTYKTMFHLARVAFARGRFEEAVDSGSNALLGMAATLGAEHPDVEGCDEELRNMKTKLGQVQGVKEHDEEM